MSQYPVFDGQIIFEMIARTPAVTNEARRIRRVLNLDETNTHESDLGDNAVWCFMVAETISVEFRLNNPDPSFLMFQAWCKALEQSRPAPLDLEVGGLSFRVPAPLYDESIIPLWELWTQIGAQHIWSQWVQCHNRVNNRFTGVKELLPPALLTPDEQEDEQLKKSESTPGAPSEI